MACGGCSGVAKINVCQMCGNDMESESVNYEKKIDPPRTPYSQILPDSRYDEEERRKKMRKEHPNHKDKKPNQICIPIPIDQGTCKSLEKDASPKPVANGKEEKAVNNGEKPKDSALTKASCLPVQPMKMMLCLPCPPPDVCTPANDAPNPCEKPRDYTYRCESRELRMSNLYSCCQCVKRNGLQDDCPRTACQGRPACLTKPWPDCWPSGGSHGIDFSRQKGTKRYDPCRAQRFDNKDTHASGNSGSDCGGNMMVVVCPPPGKK